MCGLSPAPGIGGSALPRRDEALQVTVTEAQMTADPRVRDGTSRGFLAQPRWRHLQYLGRLLSGEQPRHLPRLLPTAALAGADWPVFPG